MMDYSPFTAGQWQDALAGGLGGAIKAMTIQGSWRDKAVAVIAGGICAIYLAPLSDAILEPTIGKFLSSSDASLHLGGFICGVVGLGAVGFILGIVKKWAGSKGVDQ